MVDTNGRTAAMDIPVPRGRVVRHDPNLDTIDQYVSTGLTPKRAAAILTSADGGELGDYLQLCGELIEKDPHLGSVEETRRNAILGLEWRITPDDRSADDDAAIEVAEWMADYFAAIETFDLMLRHNARGIVSGLAVTEIVYGDGVQIAEFNPVPGTRLGADYNESRMIHVRLNASDTEGVPADPSKFVVHMPHTTTGYPTRGAPMRACILSWLAKSMGFKQWVTFVDTFGMPIPMGRYTSGATETEKTQLWTLINSLTGARGGIFSEDVQVEFVSPADKSGAPHDSFAKFCNGEMSKRILGQKLTTETDGGTGTLAAASVHDNVRRDILQADVASETRTMRALMQRTARWWWGANAPIPVFRRVVPDPVDYAAIQIRTNTAAAAGLDLSRAQLRALLDFDEPADDGDTLKPPAVAAPGLPAFTKDESP